MSEQKEFKINEELTESRLFRSKTNFAKYDAEDMTNLLFLHLISLTILKYNYEFISYVSTYSYNTSKHFPWRTFSSSYNDMSMILYVLFGGRPQDQEKPYMLLHQDKNTDLFMQRIEDFDIRFLRRWLLQNIKGTANESTDRRLLLTAEKELNIMEPDYRNLRRLALGWNDLQHNEKRTTMTRLLLAMRHRARMAEIMQPLEYLAKKEKLENTNVSDPEKGETPIGAEDLMKWGSWIGGLILGSKLGGGPPTTSV